MPFDSKKRFISNLFSDGLAFTNGKITGSSQMCTATRPNIEMATKLIKRVKGFSKLDLHFQNTPN